MPHLSCGAQFSRKALIVSNVVFLLCGITALGLGVYVLVDGNYSVIHAAFTVTEALGGAGMQWLGVIMIVVGLLTCALAVVGCLGAIHKNRTFLYVYAGFFIMIILVEFIVVILTLVYRVHLWHSYDTGFEGIFQDAYRLNQSKTIEIIERLEWEFRCCGVDSYRDYLDHNYAIPNSCYPNQIPMGVPFNEGCGTAVALWIWDKLPIIIGVLSAVLFLELFGVISSLILGTAILHSSNTLVYHHV